MVQWSQAISERLVVVLMDQLCHMHAAMAIQQPQIVDPQHAPCRQEGIQVCLRKRSWMSSSHVMINPTRRVGRIGSH
jgi:hypothetical protein